MAAVHHRPRYPAAALCAGAAGALGGGALPHSLQNHLIVPFFPAHVSHSDQRPEQPRGDSGLQAEQLGFTSSRIPGGFIGTGRHMVHHCCS
ncbi:unnamed protein product [Arctogadus glacialis]